MSQEETMSNPFFDHPILNSPYERPERHWELDEQGQPTQQIVETRRRADFISPIPKPKKRKKAVSQDQLVFDEGKGLSLKEQQQYQSSIINEVRGHVDDWRALKNPNQWQVTPETARLLQHWRHHNFSGIRPFFCQVEAIETLIWLTEVAPKMRNRKPLLDHLDSANRDANPELMRLALKMATGASKTTVMAMIIAWQTINEARHPNSKNFTRGFLVCAPGLTIKERLRVLQPNDPDSYYARNELVPGDMLDDLKRAKIVITNYHAFRLRERIDISKGGRQLINDMSDFTILHFSDLHNERRSVNNAVALSKRHRKVDPDSVFAFTGDLTERWSYGSIQVGFSSYRAYQKQGRLGYEHLCSR